MLPIMRQILGGQSILFPAGWTWTDAPIKLFRQGNKIKTNFDAAPYQNVGAGKVYYVNKTSGNDANDGLTPETALAKVYTARAKADVDIIEVAAGFYDDQYAFNNDSTAASGYKNLVIRAAPGANVILSTRRTVTFSKTAGQTNVYQVSRTLVVSVYDATNINANGDYTQFTAVASIAECDSTPNSYYYATPMLYVHTFDNRAADSNIVVFLSLVNFRNFGNYQVYLENIKFYGGLSGAIYIANTATQQTPRVIAKNCEFKYSHASNGTTILGADTIFQNCVASSNYLDGFNYHANSSRTCKSIEVNCTAYGNGVLAGTGENNGSTTHDGNKAIRVSGHYFGNEGPNVHDIKASTQTWNLGCKMHDSVATAEERNADLYVEDDAVSWFDSCNIYGTSKTSLRTVNGTTTKANIHKTDLGGKQVVTNGSIVTY